MKKCAIILVVGLGAALAAYAGLYYGCMASHHELLGNPKPELAWLKHEFNLSGPELARISHMHETYLPQCQGRCRIIKQQNEKLRQLLAQANTVSPEIKALLAERATTRAECEAAMLSHFLEISRAMPPEQGQRYLAWVEQRTLLQIQGMENTHVKMPQAYQSTPHPEAYPNRVWNE
jgi:hypothetical protein